MSRSSTGTFLHVRCLVPGSSVRIAPESRFAFAARLVRDDEERGRVQGRAEGEARAHDGAAIALRRAAEALDASRCAMEAAIARDAVTLGVEIARELLRNEIDAGRYDLERVVRETLHASGVGRGNCVVHLHPADMSRLSNVTFRSGTILEADPEVARGDVQVTTSRGLLVREIELCVQSIAERLRGDLS